MRAHVPRQVALLREATIARRTAVGFFASMRADMFRQIVAVCEATITRLAEMGTIGITNCLMNFPAAAAPFGVLMQVAVFLVSAFPLRMPIILKAWFIPLYKLDC